MVKRKIKSAFHYILSGEKLIKQGPKTVTLGVRDAVKVKKKGDK